jgi:hypothetical protein
MSMLKTTPSFLPYLSLSLSLSLCSIQIRQSCVEVKAHKAKVTNAHIENIMLLQLILSSLSMTTKITSHS